MPLKGAFMAFWRRLLCSTLFLAPGAALAQPVTGLYLGGAAGLNFHDPNSCNIGGAIGRTLARSGLSREIRTDFNLGWAGLGSVGWGFGNGWRAEIEGNYRTDEVDRLWQVCQPLLDDPPEIETYAQGSWGPTPPWERA